MRRTTRPWRCRAPIRSDPSRARDADLLNATEAMPLVQGHLDMCVDCREEFEGLLEEAGWVSGRVDR